jgi:hypothetical protein
MWSFWVNSAGNSHSPGKPQPAVSSAVFGLLLFLVFLVQMTDASLTQSLVSAGNVIEGNPVVSGLIDAGMFLPLKIMGLLLCGFLVWFLHYRFPKVALVTTFSVLLFYCGVLVWNASLII